MAHEPSAKRARSDSIYRVILNVSGTKFETTVDTLRQCSTLVSLVDVASWEADPTHCPELFLDRDPKIFERLLRFMRPPHVFAGQMPRDDPLLAAALIAEADFVGFEALLEHVKARAFRNSRLLVDKADSFSTVNGDPPYATMEEWLRHFRRGRPGMFNHPRLNWYDRTENEGKLQEHIQMLRSEGIEHGRQMYRLLNWEDQMGDSATLPWHLNVITMYEIFGGFQNAVNAACRRLPFRLTDAEAAMEFDHQFGSISEGLNAEVLPTRYFEAVAKPRVKEAASIVQLIPTQASTYFLIGHAWDNRYVSERRPPTEEDDEEDEMLPMDRWIQEPALVRRVECYALMEAKYVDEPTRTPKRWMEPVLHLTIDDQTSLINQNAYRSPMYRYATMGVPSLALYNDGGAAERTLPASRYLALMIANSSIIPENFDRDTGMNSLWTHVLVSDSPPAEVGFSRRVVDHNF